MSATRATLPDCLVIGGGGLRGLHGLGAVAQLKKAGRLAGVRHVVGTSSGAIVGYMFATGQLVRGLGLCLKAIPKRDIRIDKLSTSYGIDSGRMLDEFLEELSAPVGALTFEELLRATGVDLHVVAVNLTKRELEFFCAESTPDVLVTTAVRYSSTVPGLFGVKRSPSGDILVDGGILDNFPMERARAVTRNGSVIGISYKNAPSAEIKNIRDFMIAVVETIATPSSTACPLHGARELVLELETESISFDFGASAEDRLAWFREGVEQARLFVKKIE